MGLVRTTFRWTARLVLALAALAVLAVAVLWLFVHQKAPTGTPGKAAEALARRMMKAVNAEAWRRTGAVSWTFAGRHSYLWDRQRGLVRARWAAFDVHYRLSDREGLVWRDERRIRGVSAAEAIVAAHKRFINDSFWLNPAVKIFDRGVVRSLVSNSGGASLLTRFGSGGVTPGDAYLWEVGKDGLPRRFRMWVQILPIGGLGASFDRWVTLPTGAKIATLHRALLDIELTNVRGAATLERLTPGTDPFAALLAARPVPAAAAKPPVVAKPRSQPTTRAASRPAARPAQR